MNKLTAEEIHKLAIAPFKSVKVDIDLKSQIIKSRYGYSHESWHRYQKPKTTTELGLGYTPQ